MRHVFLVIVMLATASGFGQMPAQTQSAQTQSAQPQAVQTQPPSETTPSVPPSAPPAQTAKKGCLAVKSIGSHAVRNIMLFGVAGAIVSKQQYAVVDSIGYPARVGEKLHGADLQAISNATKVVVLDKHYSPADLHEACQ
jgi:hypothetical protein